MLTDPPRLARQLADQFIKNQIIYNIIDNKIKLKVVELFSDCIVEHFTNAKESRSRSFNYITFFSINITCNTSYIIVYINIF